jgi:hypothetical protein
LDLKRAMLSDSMKVTMLAEKLGLKRAMLLDSTKAKLRADDWG